MLLSGIQFFQKFRIWIPDQKRFGNDRFGTFARASVDAGKGKAQE